MKLKKNHPFLAFAALAASTVAVTAAPGGLDTTFNATGLATASYGGTEVANAVAVMPNGKIVVAGTTNTLGTSDISVLRYNANGTLDTTFSGDGGVITDIGTAAGATTQDFAQAVAVQADGKILVAGYTNASGANDFVTLRYNVDGTLDTFFGQGGRVITDTSSDDRASCIAIQPDGKIVVGGSNFIGSGADFSVVRYLGDGTLDPAFSTDGKYTFIFGSEDICQALTLQADGSIVMAGYTNNPGTNDFALARVTGTGTLDNTFDADGKLTKGFGNDDRASGVVVQPDGKVVVTGSWDGGSSDFALARYSSTGVPDATFSGDGFQTINFGNADFSTGVALQADGKIVMGGFSNANDASNNFAFMRFKTNGDLDDPGFDGDGRLDTTFGAGTPDRTQAIALQPNGKLVAVGFTGTDFALARYNMLIKPDARVGAKSATPGGNNIYNTTGAGQTLPLNVKRSGGKKIAYARIENDGDDSQNFKILGTPGNGNFAVKYFHGTTDITSAVQAGTLDTGSLAPHASYLVKIVITAKTNDANKNRSFFITGTSVTDTGSSDTVLVQAKTVN